MLRLWLFLAFFAIVIYAFPQENKTPNNRTFIGLENQSYKSLFQNATFKAIKANKRKSVLKVESKSLKNSLVVKRYYKKGLVKVKATVYENDKETSIIYTAINGSLTSYEATVHYTVKDEKLNNRYTNELSLLKQDNLLVGVSRNKVIIIDQKAGPLQGATSTKDISFANFVLNECNAEDWCIYIPRFGN